MRRYRVSFAPPGNRAKAFLLRHSGLDFGGADLADENVWFCCSVYDGEDPVIVILFEFKSPHDAHFTLAVSDPKGLSRHLITIIYRTVFQRADRITALVEPANERAMKQVGRMGFRQEGYLRLGYGNGQDAVLWGLIAEDCPYFWGGPFRRQTIMPTHEPVLRIQ